MLGIAAIGALAAFGCGGAANSGDEPCRYGGRTYDRGERFEAADGCNTCVCEADGRTSCTLLACETCDDAQARYSAAIDDAKACDPKQPGQCSERITEGLACGCQTYVNADEPEALAAAQAAQQAYTAMSCGDGIVCGPCQAPASAYCSTEGRCEPLFEDGEAACQVNGVIYESGASGIQDPVSCNSCECRDGDLLCTEIGCAVPCPPGTTYGTQCAHCGPSDDCVVVEHGCLPACSDSCEQGACIEGVCRRICG